MWGISVFLLNKKCHYSYFPYKTILRWDWYITARRVFWIDLLLYTWFYIYPFVCVCMPAFVLFCSLSLSLSLSLSVCVCVCVSVLALRVYFYYTYVGRINTVSLLWSLFLNIIPDVVYINQRPFSIDHSTLPYHPICSAISDHTKLVFPHFVVPH